MNRYPENRIENERRVGEFETAFPRTRTAFENPEGEQYEREFRRREPQMRQAWQRNPGMGMRMNPDARPFNPMGGKKNKSMRKSRHAKKSRHVKKHGGKSKKSHSTKKLHRKKSRHHRK